MRLFRTLLCTLAAAMTLEAAVITISNNDLPAGQNFTWTAANTYLLGGFVFVKKGSRLTIEAGTVIMGKEGAGANASALIVCRDARIYARGTPAKPIIFTSELDDPADPGYLGYDPSTTKALWGGVILCGRAPNNVNGQVGEVEGVPAEFGDLIKYGDSANAVDQTTLVPINPTARNKNIYDTTGLMEYVSIRHPGTALASGKEINGLTFYSNGKGTVIDHIEVFLSGDDGYEWFGGTLDCKYLMSIFSDDDSFDYDQAYSGRCQFLFALQNKENQRGNRLGEFDSDDAVDFPPNTGARPLAKPVWYNCTLIGSGYQSGNTLDDYALIYKENSGGTFVNSIVGDFYGCGIQIEDKPGTTDDCLGRLIAGDIKVKNNIFFNLGFGAGNMGMACNFQATLDSIKNWHDTLVDPMITGISREWNPPDGKNDPRPKAGSPALVSANAAATPVDDFFDPAPYLGAFSGPNDGWMNGWNLFTTKGFAVASMGFPTKTIGTARAAKGASLSMHPIVKENHVTVRYNLPHAGNVAIALYGMDGRLLASFTDGFQEAGRHIAQLDNFSLGKASYVVRMTSGTQTLAQKLAVVR